MEGFTLGIHDILVRPDADIMRNKIITESRDIGHRVAAIAVDSNPDEINTEELAEKLEFSYATNSKFRAIIDRQYKQALDGFTNEINK